MSIAVILITWLVISFIVLVFYASVDNVEDRSGKLRLIFTIIFFISLFQTFALLIYEADVSAKKHLEQEKVEAVQDEGVR